MLCGFTVWTWSKVVAQTPSDINTGTWKIHWIRNLFVSEEDEPACGSRIGQITLSNWFETDVGFALCVTRHSLSLWRRRKKLWYELSCESILLFLQKGYHATGILAKMLSELSKLCEKIFFEKWSKFWLSQELYTFGTLFSKILSSSMFYYIANCGRLSQNRVFVLF